MYIIALIYYNNSLGISFGTLEIQVLRKTLFYYYY